jgi:hypothetical protein
MYSLTSLNGDVGEVNKKIVHFSGTIVVLDCAEPDFQGQQSVFIKTKKNEVQKCSVLLAFLLYSWLGTSGLVRDRRDRR